MRIALLLLIAIGCGRRAPDPNAQPITQSQLEQSQKQLERQRKLDEYQRKIDALPQLTALTFSQLRKGMTPEEVMDLLGPPSATVSSVGTRKTYRWRPKEGRAIATLVFRDGKLDAWGQVGL